MWSHSRSGPVSNALCDTEMSIVRVLTILGLESGRSASENWGIFVRGMHKVLGIVNKNICVHCYNYKV